MSRTMSRCYILYYYGDRDQEDHDGIFESQNYVITDSLSSLNGTMTSELQSCTDLIGDRVDLHSHAPALDQVRKFRMFSQGVAMSYPGCVQ